MIDGGCEKRWLPPLPQLGFPALEFPHRTLDSTLYPRGNNVYSPQHHLRWLLTTYPYQLARHEQRLTAAARFLISYGSPWPGRRIFDGGCRFTYDDMGGESGGEEQMPNDVL